MSKLLAALLALACLSVPARAAVITGSYDISMYYWESGYTPETTCADDPNDWVGDFFYTACNTAGRVTFSVDTSDLTTLQFGLYFHNGVGANVFGVGEEVLAQYTFLSDAVDYEGGENPNASYYESNLFSIVGGEIHAATYAEVDIHACCGFSYGFYSEGELWGNNDSRLFQFLFTPDWSTLTYQTVPEPSVGLLIIFGLAGLKLARRHPVPASVPTRPL